MHRTLYERRTKELLRQFPAVALVGPRQSGKTTLARSLGGRYYDLEQDGDRTRLDLEWREVTTGRNLLILDEAQTWPDLFPRLRHAIDAVRGRRGRFLLLGSVSPALMKNVSESLAGRLGLMELTPLIRTELPSRHLDDLWLRGGYPEGGLLHPSRFPKWQEPYLQLMAQRDLPTWGLPASPVTTQKLFRMLAATHGTVWNASEIGRSLGLSYHTVNGYLEFLEGSYLMRRLEPFSANLRKRLIKSPRIFWRDTGLLHALWHVKNMEELLSHPRVGLSWEGFVIEQILSGLKAEGRRMEASFLRTRDGQELDLILESGTRRWAVEAKLSSQPHPEDLARLDRRAAEIQASGRLLVARVDQNVRAGNRALMNLDGALKLLKEEFTA